MMDPICPILKLITFNCIAADFCNRRQRRILLEFSFFQIEKVDDELKSWFTISPRMVFNLDCLRAPDKLFKLFLEIFTFRDTSFYFVIFQPRERGAYTPPSDIRLAPIGFKVTFFISLITVLNVFFWNCKIQSLSLNTIKTNFDLHFDFYKDFKQNRYTWTRKQRELLFVILLSFLKIKT